METKEECVNEFEEEVEVDSKQYFITEQLDTSMANHWQNNELSNSCSSPLTKQWHRKELQSLDQWERSSGQWENGDSGHWDVQSIGVDVISDTACCEISPLTLKKELRLLVDEVMDESGLHGLEHQSAIFSNRSLQSSTVQLVTQHPESVEQFQHTIRLSNVSQGSSKKVMRMRETMELFPGENRKSKVAELIQRITESLNNDAVEALSRGGNPVMETIIEIELAPVMEPSEGYFSREHFRKKKFSPVATDCKSNESENKNLSNTRPQQSGEFKTPSPLCNISSRIYKEDLENKMLYDCDYNSHLPEYDTPSPTIPAGDKLAQLCGRLKGNLIQSDKMISCGIGSWQAMSERESEVKNAREILSQSLDNKVSQLSRSDSEQKLKIKASNRGMGQLLFLESTFIVLLQIVMMLCYLKQNNNFICYFHDFCHFIASTVHICTVAQLILLQLCDFNCKCCKIC